MDTLIVCVKDTATFPKLTLVSRLPSVCTTARGTIDTSCAPNGNRYVCLSARILLTLGVRSAAYINQVSSEDKIKRTGTLLGRHCSSHKNTLREEGRSSLTRSLSTFGFFRRPRIHKLDAMTPPTANCTAENKISLKALCVPAPPEHVRHMIHRIQFILCPFEPMGRKCL